MAKILIYSDCFIFGGSENVIENLLKSSISLEHKIVFYYAFNTNYKVSVEKRFGNYSNIFSLPILSAYNKWGYKAQLNTSPTIYNLYVRIRYFISMIMQRAGIFDFFNFFVLYKTFKKQRPQILYINNGGYPGAKSCRVAVLSAYFAGIKKIVFNVNNLALKQNGLVDKWLDKKINSFVKYFVTASKAAKEQLLEYRKFDRYKCVNIPNTVLEQDELNVTSLQSNLKNEFSIHNEIVLGAVGLLTARKGFLVLINAINILKHTTSLPFKLFIFGTGEQRSLLQQKIKEYNLCDHIILPGHRSNIFQYIKDFDILICPSIANEDFPYVVIEAMLLSKPIIGTNLAGIPEQVLDGYNGFVVPVGDAGALAEKINLFFLKPDLIKAMGQNSNARYMEYFSNKLIMDRYRNLFNSLLSD